MVCGTSLPAPNSVAASYSHPRHSVFTCPNDPQGLDNLLLVSRAALIAVWVNADQWAGRFPPGSPAQWIANAVPQWRLQAHRGLQARQVFLGAPWSRVGWCLVCTECGAAGSVNIVPNWHDMIGHAIPFSKGSRN
jgi:hypothetical protein